MRKWTKELTCRRCGKRFQATFGDALLPQDQQLLQYPLCRRCRLISGEKSVFDSDNNPKKRMDKKD